MGKIKKLVDVLKQFDYVVKIAKAAIAGFDKFNEELQKSLGEDERSK